jgi:hypothetical protein
MSTALCSSVLLNRYEFAQFYVRYTWKRRGLSAYGSLSQPFTFIPIPIPYLLNDHPSIPIPHPMMNTCKHSLPLHQPTKYINTKTPHLPPRNSPSTTPSASHTALFPFIHRTKPAIHPTSQFGCLAMGGYALPSRSTLGSQVHQLSSGTESSTEGMCLPQPHQVCFSVYDFASVK